MLLARLLVGIGGILPDPALFRTKYMIPQGQEVFYIVLQSRPVGDLLIKRNPMA